ncbi:MAG: FecR family protein [Sideroxyarcus sp.]|nr:FecR family protein [Sideroxyarcus sp.]
MIPNKRFKLTRQAMLLATISAAFPISGYAAAGRVDFAIGNVESVAANGTRRPLNKGAEINAGETISTATGARAQVRFADGGFVSLQPGTQFRVDEFNFQNKTDGQEKGFFSLLKGGFRAVTGIIGRANKQTYRVKTSVATIGIRGTGYNMALRDDGLFVNVGEGAISLTNNAGLLVVAAGGSAFVADLNTPPIPTNLQPYTPPTGLQEPTFTVADQRDESGNLTIVDPIVAPSLASGPGYVMANAYTATEGTSADLKTDVTATFSTTSQLTAFTWNPDGLVTVDLGSATVPFSVTDGIIGWGRWVGDMTVAFSPLTNATFDYVIGIPTAAMPTTGTATYSLIGYTSPTSTDGSTGYSVNGSLAVDFAATSAQVGVDMTVANTTDSYGINGLASIAAGASTFNGFISTTATNGCFSGCSASINGFFAGANASRAGLSYSIFGTGSSGFDSIQGVAAFARD